MLDSVIGEFDDGLTSAAESDYGHAQGQIKAEIRKRPPPKTKTMFGGARENGSNPLNDQIDDIFSELTEEIYSVDKQQKVINRAPMLRSESTSSSNAGNRKLSPIRRVNDPLPTPPIDSSR